jgi:hypothetical protein
VGRIDRPAVVASVAAAAAPEPAAEAAPEPAAEAEPEPAAEAEPEPAAEPEPEPEPVPSLGGAHLALDEPSPLDERASAVTEAAYLDDGPATEVMDVVDDSVDEPLAEAPQEPAPDGWVTPWDTPAADNADSPADAGPGAEHAGGDPLDEPPTPAVAAPSFPPLSGATEVAPPGWVPPPPPGPPAPPAPGAPELPDAPPLPIGSWEPVGGVSAPPGPGIEHDGFTVAGAGEPPAPLVPPVPGTPAAPPVTQPVAKLLVSDGQSIIVDRAVLIGRAPEARRFTSTEQPMLVTVPSRLHEISSTHVEVRPGTGADLGTAVVTDMGSTNGTVLVQPGLGPEDLKPGIAVQLIPGATINLGDGITIQVTRP